MTTIVNTPPTNGAETSNSNSVLVAAVFFVAFLLFLVYFGGPFMRKISQPTQINVPDKVDVNINAPQE